MTTRKNPKKHNTADPKKRKEPNLQPNFTDFTVASFTLSNFLLLSETPDGILDQ